MRSFSCMFMEKPGDCSPSRKVVSKMMMRLVVQLAEAGMVDGHGKISLGLCFACD